MLVIISDLHLTDGTSGATISAGAFEIFAERLTDLATAASWRVDGRYRPIDRIDLVLLGDVLDVIRSSRWCQAGSARPWDDPYRPGFIDLVSGITSDILRANDASLSVLRELARGDGIAAAGGVWVPPGTRQGRPDPHAAPLPIPVRIHYMVGNHDWFFHLPGGSYDLLRQALVRHLGLANRYDEPFPHDARESGELADVLARHRVLARHGDIYDPFNFEGDRNASSLGDAIVVELLGRFSATVETELADELPMQALAGFRELDNVRPLLLVPVWIDGLLERTCAFPSQSLHVKRVWDTLADRFLALPYVRQRDTWHPADLVDGLESMLKFSQKLSIGWASRILGWIAKLRGPVEGSYYQHALREVDFRNRRARHIVYGHTHHAESVPLDASFADHRVLEQMYFNSGTWRRVHRQTTLAPSEHEFLAHDVMTYLAFFQGDERGGRPYETWSGSLGLQAVTEPVHRIDPARASHAARQPLSAPALHQHAPHFAPSAGRGQPRASDRL